MRRRAGGSVGPGDVSGGERNAVVRRHLRGTNPAQEAWAAWSPDGTRIAFETNRDTPPGQWQYGVYIVDLRTGEQTRLTRNALYDGPLDWSPEGVGSSSSAAGTYPTSY